MDERIRDLMEKISQDSILRAAFDAIDDAPAEEIPFKLAEVAKLAGSDLLPEDFAYAAFEIGDDDSEER